MANQVKNIIIGIGGTGGGGGGDVVGPASSVDNRLAIFDETTGKLLKDSTTITGFRDQITINAFASNSVSTIFYKDELAANRLLLFADHNNSQAGLESIGYPLLIESDSNIAVNLSSGSTDFQIIGANHPDTQSILSLQTLGTNGGVTDFHVGSRDPEGILTDTAGKFYIRDAGSSSALFLKTSDTTNVGWEPFTHKNVGVVSAANQLVTWEGTGEGVQSTPQITALLNAFIFTASSPTASSEILFKNSASANRFVIKVDHDISEVQIDTLSTYKLLIRAAGNIETRITTGSSRIDFSGPNHADTAALLNLSTGGTNSGNANIHLTSRDPEGNITATGGALAIRDAGASSAVYLKTSETTNVDWEPFTHKDTTVTSAAGQLVTWEGTAEGVLSTPQMTAAGDTFSFTASSTVATSDIQFFNSSSLERGGVGIDHQFSRMEIHTESTYDIDINSAGGIICQIGGTTEQFIVQGATTPDTTALLQIAQGGTNGGVTTITVSDRQPEGNLTRDGGALVVVDSATVPDVLLKVGDASNTGWESLKSAPTARFANIYLDFTIIGTGQLYTTTRLKFNGFSINGESFAGLTPNHNNNQIDINNVIDTTSGDLYRFNLDIGFAGSSNIEFQFFLIYDNGNGTSVDTGHDTLWQATGTNIPESISMSGIFRGPTSLVGTGHIAIEVATKASTGFVNTTSNSLTVERINF